MLNIYQKSRKTVDYLKFENKIYENYNHFPIGLILIERDEKEFKVGIINNYAYDIFELYHDSDFEDLKNQMQKFKKWENNSLQDLNLYNFIFTNNSSKEYCGTFISSLSMIYVKINNYNNCIFLSIDNYNDERKDLQGSLVKSLKYQYLVTLYHELNNPLNALMNISDDFNFESNNEGKKDFDEIKLKLKQINLLVLLIKMFIKNFIWYFRVIFELTNNIETNSISKINLEYLFSKNINKYKNLFKYKEIGYEKNYNFLRDKFILSDSKHMNNFFSGIFVYLYHILPKKNGFTIKHTILKEDNLKINFIKIVKNPSHKGRRSLILEDIDLNKKTFDFTQSVQTIEITKELLLRLSNMLHLKLKFYSETDSEDLILSIILKFSYEKVEILEDDDINEFTPQQKLITLNGINRTIPIYNNWQSFINDGHNEVDNNSSSQIQTSLTTMNLNNTTNTNNINYNYNITISVPNENVYNNNYTQYGLYTNSNIKTKNSEQNDILKLENDPFIRMTKENNPFTKETKTNKLNDSFISGSNTVISDILINKDEDDNIFFKNHSTHHVNIYSYNPLNYQKKFDINYNNNVLKFNKKAISYEKSNKTVNVNNKTINDKNMPKMLKYKTNKIENVKMKHLKKKKIKCKCNDVLLCDDEEFNLSTIKNMLKKFNVNSDLSTNGQECIDAILKKKKLNCNCDKKHYKLILLDMMMPIMNGFDASKKIQEMIDKNEINNLKIVIVSAHIEDNLINCLKQFKCIVEEVPKPLKKKKLQEILNNYYFKN